MELGLTFPLQRFLKRKPPVGVLGQTAGSAGTCTKSSCAAAPVC